MQVTSCSGTVSKKDNGCLRLLDLDGVETFASLLYRNATWAASCLVNGIGDTCVVQTMEGKRKRKARATESAVEHQVRVIEQSGRKKKRQKRGTVVTTNLQALNCDTAHPHVQRLPETRLRNSRNQHSVVLKKANEKSTKSKERLKNYSSSQGLDRKSFFERIDEPLTFICGSCGELSNPRKMTVVKLTKNAKILNKLAYEEDEVRCEGIVPEAIVQHKHSRTAPFCDSCMCSLRTNQVPKFSAAAGFRLASIPEELAADWTWYLFHQLL